MAQNECPVKTVKVHQSSNTCCIHELNRQMVFFLKTKNKPLSWKDTGRDALLFCVLWQKQMEEGQGLQWYTNTRSEAQFCCGALVPPADYRATDLRHPAFQFKNKPAGLVFFALNNIQRHFTPFSLPPCWSRLMCHSDVLVETSETWRSWGSEVEAEETLTAPTISATR